MNRAPAFVLLEMMNAMLLVAQEAKARGYAVIALNHDPLRDSGPFAVPDGLVDELIPVASWADRDALRATLADLVGRYTVVGTHGVFEAVLPAEAALREAVGLPTTGVTNTLRVLDKCRVRRKLHSEGLSALRSASLSEALAWPHWPFDGPAIVKPANGTGSALCIPVSSMPQLQVAAAKAAAAEVVNPLMKQYILAHGEFVVEEMATGELLSVESMVCRGEVHVIGLTGRYVLASDPVVEQGLFFPYHHPLLPQILDKTVQLHRSLGIHHGPTHVEVMVAEDGSVELIDFNARFSGFASAVSMSEAFGLRFERVLVDVACGEPPDLGFLDGDTRFAAEMVVLPPPGEQVLREVTFTADAIAPRLMKPVGQRLSGRADQLDAVAMFIIAGDTASQTHHRALDARRETVVNGRPLGDNPNNLLAFAKHIGRDLPVMSYASRSQPGG